MRTSKIWVTLIVALLFFSIANAPASLLRPYLKNSIGIPFTLSGTIWKGSMHSNYFTSASWKVDPLYLLIAKVSIQLTAELDAQNRINTTAEISPFKKLTLNSINGNLTTQYLQQFLPNMPFIFSSNIEINQANASWNNSLPPNLPSESKGNFLIKEVNFLGEKLGDYKFNFVYLNQILEGSISSSTSSSIDTNLKVNISSKKILTIAGEILPKTKVLQLIFKELNINLNPNIVQNLDF